jgi:hypothetical protein
MSTVRIQVRRGTASEWTTANPVLAAGEMGVETNTNKFKFGNGSSAWTALSYAASDSAAISEISQDAIDTALTMGAGLTKTYNDGANTITITVDTSIVSTKAFATSEATAKAAAALATAQQYADQAANTVNNSLSSYLEVADRGVANGVASLNNLGKVLESELNLVGMSSNITTSGNVSAENITVGGNLVVNGTTTTLNTQNVSIEDTLLYIAENNQSSQLDIGFVGAHNTGTYNHTGLVRDASDNKWKLFKGVTDEPTTTINFTQATLDNIAVGAVEATSATVGNLTASGTVNLPDNAIAGNYLAAGVVTAAKIAPLAVTVEKLAADSVDVYKIQDNAVTSVKIINDAVTESKIINSAVTEGKIAAGSVTLSKLAIDSVSTAKIIDSAVTADKLNVGAVSTAKIVDSAVTAAKLADSAVTASKIATDAVTSDKIATDAVTADKIAANTITSSEIAASAVNTEEIALGAVTTDKLAALAVTSDKIALEAVGNGQISATAAIAQSKINGLPEALELLSAKASPTFTGTVTLPNTTSIGTVSSTEISYLDGVTSSVQTQITAAGTALANHESDTTNVHGIADTSVLATATTVATAKSEAIAAAAADATTKADAAKAAAEATAAAALSGAISTEVSGRNSAIATAKSEAIADATARVNAVIAAAPAALNTLDELAAALGDDANFAGTITSGLALKAPIASPTFTGTVTVAAAGIAFSDGTQTRAGVPSITTIGSARSSSETLVAGEQDKFVPVSGAVVITLPSSGYSTGQSIDFWQETGTGASFASTNGVVGTPGLKFRTTNSVVTALKISSGWLVFGDLSA